MIRDDLELGSNKRRDIGVRRNQAISHSHSDVYETDKSLRITVTMIGTPCVIIRSNSDASVATTFEATTQYVDESFGYPVTTAIGHPR